MLNHYYVSWSWHECNFLNHIYLAVIRALLPYTTSWMNWVFYMILAFDPIITRPLQRRNPSSTVTLKIIKWNYWMNFGLPWFWLEWTFSSNQGIPERFLFIHIFVWIVEVLTITPFETSFCEPGNNYRSFSSSLLYKMVPDFHSVGAGFRTRLYWVVWKSTTTFCWCLISTWLRTP